MAGLVEKAGVQAPAVLAEAFVRLPEPGLGSSSGRGLVNSFFPPVVRADALTSAGQAPTQPDSDTGPGPGEPDPATEPASPAAPAVALAAAAALAADADPGHEHCRLRVPSGHCQAAA